MVDDSGFPAILSDFSGLKPSAIDDLRAADVDMVDLSSSLRSHFSMDEMMSTSRDSLPNVEDLVTFS
jgi:hypothetical protein